ncbi:MAG: hypothetical protein KIT27_01675, partial [Legionellales bacterium]|nr:hypothetical protein [Legionellales bacterium]
QEVENEDPVKCVIADIDNCISCISSKEDDGLSRVLIERIKQPDVNKFILCTHRTVYNSIKEWHGALSGLTCKTTAQDSQAKPWKERQTVTHIKKNIEQNTGKNCIAVSTPEDLQLKCGDGFKFLEKLESQLIYDQHGNAYVDITDYLEKDHHFALANFQQCELTRLKNIPKITWLNIIGFTEELYSKINNLETENATYKESGFSSSEITFLKELLKHSGNLELSNKLHTESEPYLIDHNGKKVLANTLTLQQGYYFKNKQTLYMRLEKAIHMSSLLIPAKIACSNTSEEDSKILSELEIIDNLLFNDFASTIKSRYHLPIHKKIEQHPLAQCFSASSMNDFGVDYQLGKNSEYVQISNLLAVQHPNKIIIMEIFDDNLEDVLQHLCFLDTTQLPENVLLRVYRYDHGEAINNNDPHPAKPFILLANAQKISAEIWKAHQQLFLAEESYPQLFNADFLLPNINGEYIKKNIRSYLDKLIAENKLSQFNFILTLFSQLPADRFIKDGIISLKLDFILTLQSSLEPLCSAANNEKLLFILDKIEHLGKFVNHAHTPGLKGLLKILPKFFDFFKNPDNLTYLWRNALTYFEQITKRRAEIDTTPRNTPVDNAVKITSRKYRDLLENLFLLFLNEHDDSTQNTLKYFLENLIQEKNYSIIKFMISILPHTELFRDELEKLHESWMSSQLIFLPNMLITRNYKKIIPPDIELKLANDYHNLIIKLLTLSTNSQDDEQISVLILIKKQIAQLQKKIDTIVVCQKYLTSFLKADVTWEEISQSNLFFRETYFKVQCGLLDLINHEKNLPNYFDEMIYFSGRILSTQLRLKIGDISCYKILNQMKELLNNDQFEEFRSYALYNFTWVDIVSLRNLFNSNSQHIPKELVELFFRIKSTHNDNSWEGIILNTKQTYILRQFLQTNEQPELANKLLFSKQEILLNTIQEAMVCKCNFINLDYFVTIPSSSLHFKETISLRGYIKNLIQEDLEKANLLLETIKNNNEEAFKEELAKKRSNLPSLFSQTHGIRIYNAISDKAKPKVTTSGTLLSALGTGFRIVNRGINSILNQ